MKRLILIAMVLLLSSSMAVAQNFCKGDHDFDGDCDSDDVTSFIQDFGRNEFNNPCPPDGPSPVAKTGRTTCYSSYYPYDEIDCEGTGEDGESQRGVEWPNPRFTDNGDGTVTDNLTGLIWMKVANCLGQRIWEDAISGCKVLADGLCMLTDGSSAGDWRVPNRRELFSLIHDGYGGPAVPNTAGTGQWSYGDPFLYVQSNWYWSSNANGASAWSVNMSRGQMGTAYTFNERWVWPVRGGR